MSIRLKLRSYGIRFFSATPNWIGYPILAIVIAIAGSFVIGFLLGLIVKFISLGYRMFS